MDMNFGGHPMHSRTVHRVSLLTVSKALVRSLKTENRGICFVDALLLELSHGKNHVYSTSSGSEATLRLWEVLL